MIGINDSSITGVNVVIMIIVTLVIVIVIAVIDSGGLVELLQTGELL
jgi:hypothetical protein